jgi:hypothetical protein
LNEGFREESRVSIYVFDYNYHESKKIKKHEVFQISCFRSFVFSWLISLFNFELK